VISSCPDPPFEPDRLVEGDGIRTETGVGATAAPAPFRSIGVKAFVDAGDEIRQSPLRRPETAPGSNRAGRNDRRSSCAAAIVLDPFVQIRLFEGDQVVNADGLVVVVLSLPFNRPGGPFS